MYVPILNCMQTSGQTTAGKDKNSLGWALLDPKLVVRTCSDIHIVLDSKSLLGAFPSESRMVRIRVHPPPTYSEAKLYVP